MRRTAVVLVSLLSLCLAACGSSHPSTSSDSAAPATSNGAAPPSGTPDKLATDAAYAFLDAYTTDGGRIQRTDQGGDTVGEGQAYGMLAAAAVGDQQRFDRIWSWTEHNMLDGDGLLAFHWARGRVVDSQPAADADLDAARALLVAACSFNRPDLRSAAIRIGNAGAGTGDGKGGIDVCPARRTVGEHGVSPRLQSELRRPDDARGARDRERRFTFPRRRRGRKAARRRAHPSTSARLGDRRHRNRSGDPGVRRRLDVGAPVHSPTTPRARWSGSHSTRIPRAGATSRGHGACSNTPSRRDIVTEHQLTGTPIGTSHDAVTMVAAAGAAKAAGDTSAVPRLLAQAQELNTEHPTYYGTAWVALGRLMLTTSRLQPCRS